MFWIKFIQKINAFNFRSFIRKKVDIWINTSMQQFSIIFYHRTTLRKTHQLFKTCIITHRSSQDWTVLLQTSQICCIEKQICDVWRNTVFFTVSINLRKSKSIHDIFDLRCATSLILDPRHPYSSIFSIIVLLDCQYHRSSTSAIFYILWIRYSMLIPQFLIINILDILDYRSSILDILDIII